MTISTELTLSTLQSVASLNSATSVATSSKPAQSAPSGSSAPAQLAADTYTASGATAGATTASATTSSQPGPETTLDGQTLAQNQTISADLDVRGALLQAGNYYVSPADQAWSTLTQSLASGNVAAAQTALTAYTQALPSDPSSLSSLTSPSTQFLSDLNTLGSALKSGDLTTAQTVFKTAQYDKPDNALGVVSLAHATGDTSVEATMSSEAVASITAQLTWLGYTPTNAKIEANIIEIAGEAGLTTGSNQPESSQTNQMIVDLAQDVASGPELTASQSGRDSNSPFSNIVTSLLTMASPSDLTNTLELLASTYGTGSSSNTGAATNSSSSGPTAGSVSTYA